MHEQSSHSSALLAGNMRPNRQHAPTPTDDDGAPCLVQCKRPMNRRAKWSDDATWAAVKYCSDRCRKESKRNRPAPERP